LRVFQASSKQYSNRWTVLFKRRKRAWAALQRLAKENERAVEILKALLPSDIGVGCHIHTTRR
jgi:hypothetical protein